MAAASLGLRRRPRSPLQQVLRIETVIEDTEVKRGSQMWVCASGYSDAHNLLLMCC